MKKSQNIIKWYFCDMNEYSYEYSMNIHEYSMSRLCIVLLSLQWEMLS